MSRPKIRLILFDAFETLLHPRIPPEEQYVCLRFYVLLGSQWLQWLTVRSARMSSAQAEEARRMILPRVASDAAHAKQLREQLSISSVRTAFRTAYKSVWSAHPLYGARTSIASEPDVGSRTGPDAWWALVIARTFDAVIKLVPNLEDDKTVMNDLQTSLLDRFASARAYMLFPDVAPALSALRAQFPGVSLGIASNSDTRILTAMHDLGVDQWMNIQPGHAAQPSAAAPAWPPALLSYALKIEKPSAGFFEACLRAASSSEENPIQPEEALYIGDHLQEDFRAARKAHMNALWLRRPSSDWIYSGAPIGNVHKELAANGLSEEEKVCVIQSLQDIPRWLQANRSPTD